MASSRSVTGAPAASSSVPSGAAAGSGQAIFSPVLPDRSDPAAGQRCSRSDRDPLTFAYVTWEERAQPAIPNGSRASSCPDIRYADFAKLIGLDGLRVE